MKTVRRRYFDEEAWEEIEVQKARDSLEKFFLDAEPVLDDLERGYLISTDVAEYRAG